MNNIPRPSTAGGHLGAIAFALALLVCGPASVTAENWPQWRGPRLNGTAEATNLPVTWSETENIRWKTKLPSWSGATPIVWEDRLFVMSPDGGETARDAVGVATEGESTVRGRRGRVGGPGGGRGGVDPGGQVLQLICLSRDDGRVLWTREVDRGNRTYRKQNNSSPSPVTDGKHVWSLTGNGVLTCFDLDGGKRWERRIQDDYGQFGLNWGYGSSPLLVEDRLIIPVLHGNNTDDPSYVLAVDKATGKTVWRTERPTEAQRESPDSYVTPQLLRIGDRAEVVLNGGDVVTGHDLGSGREIWRADVLNPNREGNYRIIPSCLIVGDLIIAPSRINPMVALRSGGRGDVSRTHTAWVSANGPDVPTPVSDGRYLWMVTGDRSLFSCLEVATGEARYDRERLPTGTYSASPVLAEGRIYLMNESCETVVIEAGPEFKILATNVLDGANGLSSPAIVGSEIFLRTSGALYCVAKSEEAAPVAESASVRFTISGWL